MILQEFRLSSAGFPLTAHKGWATLGTKAPRSFLKIPGGFQLHRPGDWRPENIFAELWQLRCLGLLLDSHPVL